MLMVRCPWGSRSMQRTRLPISASAPPRLTAVVVLPTPPFWLAMARTRVILVRPSGPDRTDALHQGVIIPKPRRPEVADTHLGSVFVGCVVGGRASVALLSPDRSTG